MPTRTLPAVHRIPFADLDAFPDLFVDVANRDPQALSYYAGDWGDAETRRTVAETVARQPADRTVLADTLIEQNKHWSPDGTLPPAVAANIDALRDPESVAIVTGQQAGFFGGPLYTIYKTITALQLAEEVAEETGRPVVPVFWIAGEDHDFEEIAHTSILHRNEIVRLEYPASQLPNGDRDNAGPVGRIELSGEINALLDMLDGHLPDSDFKPRVIGPLRQAYQEGATIGDAFARLIRSVFSETGLVLIKPDDARLKRLAQPLFRRDLTDSQTAVDAVLSAGEQLEQEGYHAQVHAAPTNLFLLDDDGRLPIDREDDGFRLRGTDRTFTETELLDRLDTSPEDFSPNVVLRPLMQDTLLPTLAYIAGPGETSYFAQYKSVYQWAEMQMPLIHPRASVSLVESKVQAVLDAFDLSIADLTGDVERLFQTLVLHEMDVDVDAVFGEALAEIHGAINNLKPHVEEVDRTLVKSAEAARAAIANEMNDLKQRVVRAEKRQQDELRAKLDKACVNLVPGGTLQERRINVLYFLNKYSPALIGDLQAALSTDTSAHQVVNL
jgi:bacillithiol synthase